MVRPIGTGSPASTAIETTRQTESPKETTNSAAPPPSSEQKSTTSPKQDGERQLAENVLAEKAFAGIFRSTC